MLIAYARAFFIELKSTRGRIARAQSAKHDSLLRLGHVVRVIDSIEQFRQLVDNYKQD